MAEPAALALSPAGTDTIFEPQLVTLSGSLGASPFGEVTVTALSGRLAQNRQRYDSFATPGWSLSQALLAEDLFSLSFAPTVELPSTDRGAAYDELTLALPLGLSGGWGALSWSNELAYRAAPGADEMTMDASLQLNITPTFSVMAGMLLTTPATLQNSQAQWSGAFAWQPDDSLLVAASMGRGLRDTPFDQDETLAVASLSLVL